MPEQIILSKYSWGKTYLANVGVERPRDLLYVVLHHSGGVEEGDVRWLTETGQVSCHKYCAKNGNRYQFVPDENASWTCAVDPQFEILPHKMGERWSRNENWPALQIELENRGSEPFTDPQYEAAADWTADWVIRYGIPADRNNIIGHRELTRHPQHQDPNDYWDWTRFMNMVRERLDKGNYVDYYIESAATMSRQRFHDVLGANPRSPITDESDKYYDLCLQYRINPAIALAFFVKESSKGTAGISVQTLSWGNQRRARVASRSSGTMQTQWGPFAIYKSWLDSLADWCENLLSKTYKGEGRTTVRSVIPKYAPSFENDTALYIRQTVDRITSWKDIASETFLIDYPIRSDPTMSRTQFLRVLQLSNSPAQESADSLYTICIQNGGVNPAVALAFFYGISRCGTNYSDPKRAENRNWGEVVGDGKGVGGVQAYPTWEQGLIDWCRIMVTTYGAQGFSTIGGVLQSYKPNGLSDPAGVARSLSELITEWKREFDNFGFTPTPASPNIPPTTGPGVI